VVTRLEDIPGFNIDRVAAAAGDDPDVLQLENLDTDIPPPPEAIEATRAAIGVWRLRSRRRLARQHLPCVDEAFCFARLPDEAALRARHDPLAR
jgi:hypothetical protein